MVTLRSPDLQAIVPEGVLARPAGAVYGGAPQAVAVAPDGTLVELVGGA
jgi:hypothetical protein